MAAVSIVAVSKRFGSTPVLNGISLDIVDGEFLTLVGTLVNKSKAPQAVLAQMTKDVEALLPKRS